MLLSKIVTGLPGDVRGARSRIEDIARVPRAWSQDDPNPVELLEKHPHLVGSWLADWFAADKAEEEVPPEYRAIERGLEAPDFPEDPDETKRRETVTSLMLPIALCSARRILARKLWDELRSLEIETPIREAWASSGEAVSPVPPQARKRIHREWRAISPLISDEWNVWVESWRDAEFPEILPVRDRADAIAAEVFPEQSQFQRALSWLLEFAARTTTEHAIFFPVEYEGRGGLVRATIWQLRGRCAERVNFAPWSRMRFVDPDARKKLEGSLAKWLPGENGSHGASFLIELDAVEDPEISISIDVVGGDSLLVAILLASIAIAAEEELRELVASATVGAAGVLGTVGNIPAKMEAVAYWWKHRGQVQDGRLLVAPAHRGEAAAALGRMPSPRDGIPTVEPSGIARVLDLVPSPPATVTVFELRERLTILASLFESYGTALNSKKSAPRPNTLDPAAATLADELADSSRARPLAEREQILALDFDADVADAAQWLCGAACPANLRGHSIPVKLGIDELLDRVPLEALIARRLANGSADRDLVRVARNRLAAPWSFVFVVHGKKSTEARVLDAVDVARLQRKLGSFATQYVVFVASDAHQAILIEREWQAPLASGRS
jgi:hypothetical protein